MEARLEYTLAAMPLEASDEAMATLARGGDAEAYAALVGRYRDVAYAYALTRLRSRDDAEDVAQEAFIRAYGSLGQYRGGGSWGAWLMRIVRNLCTDAERRRRVRRAEPIPEEWLDARPGPEGATLAQDERARLLAAVEGLPEQFRLPLVLHYWARLTYRQVALALGIRESTAIGRVAVALRRLRKTFKQETMG
jgi:RNA polymerase sigma-70 factor (ECF subfamily)